MQPCVSMVMPCYNKKDYIDLMLESVANQVWNNIELIMVNDGSTDGTREIIAGWIPRLEKRGYAVIVVDQENAGTADAVKNGLDRITGAFVCCVDCDDRLHPEYVSRMASFLMSHPDYDMVSCEYEMLRRAADGTVMDDVPLYAAQPFSEHFLEDLLLFRCGTMIWCYLIRTEYLKACRVREHFFTRQALDAAGSLKPVLAKARSKNDIYINQEPSFVMPLASGGGRGFCLPDKLYRHNQLDAGNNVFRRAMSVIYTHITTYIYGFTVDSLQLSAGKRKRLAHVLDLASVRLRYFHTDVMHEKNNEYVKRCAADAADCANRAFVPSPGIDSELIRKTGYRVFFQAVENSICGHETKKPDLTGKGRVIGLGACGNIAKELIPALRSTELECDLLWDSGAREECRQNAVAIAKPEFDALQPNDIVLVLAKRERLHKFAEAQLAGKPFVRRLSFFDVLDFLAVHYYGNLRNCRFAAD